MTSGTTGSGNQSGKSRKLKGLLALLLSFVLCASMLPAVATTALATQEDSAAESGEIALLSAIDGPLTPSITYVSVKVSASPEEGGEVSGGGTKASGSSFTVEAAPNTGWHFVEWQRNDAKVSDDESYTFRAYSSQTLTAVFEKDTYEIDASPNDAAFGSTTGSGTYAHGEEVTLTATANEGYHFVEWQEDGARVDGAGATYAFTAEKSRTLIAVFEKNPPVVYTIIYGAGQLVIQGNAAVFVSDAPFAKFSSVQVDGEDIDASNYSVEEGSTKVTLTAEYTKSLSLGEHDFAIVSNDGEATCTFTIGEAVPQSGPNDEPAIPQTGDGINVFPLAMVALVSMAVLLTCAFCVRRKQAPRG